MVGESLTRKLIERHLVSGKPVAGEEIGLAVDQVLLTDTNGAMAWLQFEAMGAPRVTPSRVVSYIDHNVYAVDSRNSDDHRYMETVSRRYGAWFSKPGNGICHQVHFESFSVPGQFVLGTDSHTPLCGSTGMLAIGAGGLDVAVAMGGGPYYLAMPRVVRVRLTGRLRPWVSAKDVILELLRRYTVRGGSGKIFEYGGPGAATLSLPQRATICNMGAELTLTTSVFPSDETTREYFRLLGRESEWQPLAADPDAEYDEEIELDLGALEPLIALPSSPDRVVPVAQVAGTPIEQVVVGSCTNSSWEDMWAVSHALAGRHVAPSVSFVVFPGSHRILEVMAREGLLADLLAAGANVSEPTCGSCAGIGHVPATGTKSLRAFNRNFPGRSGTGEDAVYLCSPVTAAASAVTGVITDPREAGAFADARYPASLAASMAGLLPPAAAADAERTAVIKGPNIKDVPRGRPVPDESDRARAHRARRQGVDGRHLAVRHPEPDVPHQRPRDLGVLLPERRSDLRRARESSGRRHHRGRRALRSGLLARGGSALAPPPRNPRGAREELRPHPPRQPHQLGDRATRVRRSGRSRGHRAG